MSEYLDINPVHLNLQNAGSTSTHTSLTSGYQSSNKAYQSLTTVGSTSTHTSFKSTGFQYLFGTPTITKTFEEDINVSDSLGFAIKTSFEEDINVTDSAASQSIKPFEDDINVIDSLAVFITKFFEEDVNVNDSESTFDGVKRLEEDVNVIDSLVTIITKSFEEDVTVNDSLSGSITKLFEEDINVTDNLSESILYTFEEDVNVTDTAVASVVFNDKSSMLIHVVATFTNNYGFTVNVASPMSNSYGLSINVTPDNFVPITNASSVSNPTTPTIIIGGTVYNYNSSTAPPPGYTVTPDTYWVNWNDVAFGNTNSCSILKGNVTINYSGGNFDIETITSPGGLNQEITINGLLGTVTESGLDIGNGVVGAYANSGIFGSRNFDKPLNLLAANNIYLYQLLMNQNVAIQGGTSRWLTYSQVAQAIGSIAGIGVSWAIQDYPYMETFSQSGGSAGSALASLAAQVGGTLRWNGNNSYIVCYPNLSQGTWYVPNTDRLLTSVKTRSLLNLEYGVSGTGLFSIPILNLFDGTTKNVSGTSSTGPQIQTVYTGKNMVFDSDTPEVKIPLPNDMQELYIQILVVPNSNDSTGSTASRYTQTDDTKWTNLGSPSITNSFCKITQSLGSSYTPNLIMNSSNLPNLDLINNGQYVLKFGVTRNDLTSAYANAKAIKDAIAQNVLARTIGQFTFVPTAKTSLVYKYFGSIPMPGMAIAPFTICNGSITIDPGIIESVTYNTASKEISIEAAKYARINFIQRLFDINTGNVTTPGLYPPILG